MAAAPARAQEPKPTTATTRASVAADTAKFFGGAALALGMHESGHLVLDAAFDASPTIKRVHFGPFPFFAVAHRPGLPPRREFAISSAGFWVQEATDEWLFARHTNLRHEHAPLLKGMLAFNVLASVGYAAAAFAEAGPFERDTRGMAASMTCPSRRSAWSSSRPPRSTRGATTTRMRAGRSGCRGSRKSGRWCSIAK